MQELWDLEPRTTTKNLLNPQGTQGTTGTHQMGNYFTKGYSSISLESSLGDAAHGYRPDGGACQAKRQTEPGYGVKIGGVIGGIGAAAGIARAARVLEAGEVRHFSSIAGKLGSQGVGSAQMSPILGYNKVN